MRFPRNSLISYLATKTLNAYLQKLHILLFKLFEVLMSDQKQNSLHAVLKPATYTCIFFYFVTSSPSSIVLELTLWLIITCHRFLAQDMFVSKLVKEGF